MAITNYLRWMFRSQLGEGHVNMEGFLDLVSRSIKPRRNGLTLLIDNGYPLNYFSDVVVSHGHLIDYVKFGWGTAYITKDIHQKIDVLAKHNIKFFLGGTFFEKAYVQKKIDKFVKYVQSLGGQVVEVSNGTVPITNTEKAAFITELSSDFEVLSEVGYKDNARSQELRPAKWIEFINQDLKAGASYVITEARESGRGGVCRDNGELRYGLIEEIIHSGINLKQIIFEAPKRALQIYFIKQVGYDANLANIAFDDIIGLETLRLGLRADTLLIRESDELCEREI